jgi:hypothetical protein
MTDLFLDEVFTAKELAAKFGYSIRTIQNHANKLFGTAKNGVTRTFDKAQVTLILDSMKNASISNKGNQHTDLDDLATSKASLLGTETDLSLFLELKKISDDKDKLHDRETEVLNKIIGIRDKAITKLEKKVETLEGVVKQKDETIKHIKEVHSKKEIQFSFSNAMLARLAESKGNIVSDKEDTENTYRRNL